MDTENRSEEIEVKTLSEAAEAETRSADDLVREESGQGIVEYAVLLSVLVVIGIVFLNNAAPIMQQVFNRVIETLQTLIS